MSRIKLADISALTLYQGEVTSSRRGKPIPQLVCKGKPCKLFTPDVVRCVNLGGEDTDVDWKVRYILFPVRDCPVFMVLQVRSGSS